MKSRKFVRVFILGIAALIIVVFLCLLLGRPSMEPNEKFQFDAAEAAYKAGNFPEAEEAYLKAKDLAPRNAQILSRLGDISLYKNQPDEAIGYYNEALDNTPWFLNVWPLNVQLKKQLGMAYYRQDRFAEASQYFREAAGPVNLGPFKMLKALSEYTDMFANQDTYIIEGPEQSRIDFVITDPLPVVKVSVNGNEPQNFFLDTGGAEVLIVRSAVEQFEAKVTTSFGGEYGGGKKGETGLGKIETLRIGEYTVRNVPIMILDLDESITQYKNLDIKGVIGTRLFMHFIPTIDYADGALILRKINPENLKNLEVQAAAANAQVIPFWLIDLHFIMATGTINNQSPTLFFVDTGLADKGFKSSESILKAAGVTVDWTKAREGVGGGGKYKTTDFVVDRLTLGTGSNEIVGNDVPGSVSETEHSIFDGSFGFRIGGLISHSFFRKYAVTFDFTNMRMIIQ